MRALLVMAGLTLFAAPATAQELPEGTFASSKEGCDRLATKTPDQLGKNFDFSILTKTGTESYGHSCSFLNVTPRNETSWLATAFCDDEGYIYPDMFAIAQKDDGTLGVTRTTDSAPEQSFEAPGDSEDLPADNLDPSEVGATQKPAEPAENAFTPYEVYGAFSAYFRCETVRE